MKFEEYLNKLKEDVTFGSHEKNPTALLFASNSLGGECGELQNIIKKVYRDDTGNPNDRLNEMILELGDILWCWVRICDILQVNPTAIMDINIDKFIERGYLK